MTIRPLRVAHIVATAGRSGVESHLLALLPAFDPSEVRARLFVPGPGPLVEALAKLGFHAETGAPLRKLAWEQARSLAARLAGECDILHAHGPRAAFWSAAVVGLARIPIFICTQHELRWRSLPPGPKRMLWVALEQLALSRAARIITLSRDSAGHMREKFPGLAARLTPVPGSTPLLADADSLTRARPGSVVERVRVVAIGRFQWGKRHDRLLDALALAVQKGADLELHLAGDGPLRETLQARARSLGIQSRVTWVGEFFDVQGLLGDGHIFASASHSEVCSVAALEAMAMGLPLVTCVNGGVSELIEHEASGLVVPASSDQVVVEGLAASLLELARDPAKRAALGEAAARRAQMLYSPATMARATTEVYLSARTLRR